MYDKKISNDEKFTNCSKIAAVSEFQGFHGFVKLKISI